MPNSKITGLPANTGLAADTLFEDVKDPSGLTLSQKVKLSEIATFLFANIASLSIAGGKILLNADGSVSFATGTFTQLPVERVHSTLMAVRLLAMGPSP